MVSKKKGNKMIYLTQNKPSIISLIEEILKKQEIYIKKGKLDEK